MDIWTVLTSVLIILLFISGLFGWIEWKFNIPAIVVLIIFYLIGIYNDLVTKKTEQRRHGLILMFS